MSTRITISSKLPSWSRLVISYRIVNKYPTCNYFESAFESAARYLILAAPEEGIHSSQTDRRDAEAWAKLRHEAVQLHPYAFGTPLPDNLDMLVESIHISNLMYFPAY